ncbi:MAG: M48 family metallopeptidase [Chloroflexi bacterium]|nr:M48 family metallopeptidase [Chloroflexota bacterium]
MDVRVIRSKARQKTVSARMVDGVCEIRAPYAIDEAELKPIIENLIRRLQKKQARESLDDNALERRAQWLNERYFDGKLQWSSIRWVANQRKRAGSCTPALGTIRISSRMATVPAFVRDYVIVHELAHLIEPQHSPRFWKLLNKYPRTERARGYLMALGAEDVEDLEE